LRNSRANTRTSLLLLAEAAVVFGAIVGAVYLRLGAEDSHVELMLRQGFLKAALATLFCLAVAVARIAINAHWPSDVLEGLVGGIGVLALVALLTHDEGSRRPREVSTDRDA